MGKERWRRRGGRGGNQTERRSSLQSRAGRGDQPGKFNVDQASNVRLARVFGRSSRRPNKEELAREAATAVHHSCLASQAVAPVDHVLRPQDQDR